MLVKVLHLVKTSTGGTWALRQMREQVRLGLEVHAALPTDGPLIPHYQKGGVSLYPLQTDFPARSLRLLPERCRNLRNLIASIKPDIIHSHFVGTTLTMRIALGKKFSIPRVFQVPGPLHLEHPFFRHLELMTAGDWDHWIGSCEWTRQKYLASGIPEDRVFLSYYGTDIDDFTSRQPGKLRRERDISPETKIIGMVAFMYAPKRYLGQKKGLKGHEDLLDALAICREKRSDIVGVFVGGAWNKKVWYEQKVRSYGKKRCGRNAIFVGTRTDVADLYPDIDVAVHPSHSENVGGVVESLLAGVPTIATNIGGFPDLIKHGETGWLVPSRHPEKLADAILEVLKLGPNDSKKVAMKGKILTQETFNVRKTAQQVVHIYSSIT